MASIRQATERKIRNLRLVLVGWCAVLSAATVPAFSESAKQPSLTSLRELKPLAKVHHSYGSAGADLTKPSPELLEVIRICRSIPISGLSSESQVVAAGLHYVATKTALAINLSPWPVARCPSKTPVIKELLAEVGYWDRWMRLVQQIIGDAQVAVVLIDDERYPDCPDLMLTWRNALHETCKAIFPNASVELYGFLGVTPEPTNTGWTESHPWTGCEKTDARSVALYKVAHTYLVERTYVETCSRNSGQPVTPWIALGAGYRPCVPGFHAFTSDWDYSLSADWFLGRQIGNDWFAAAHRVHPTIYAPWDRARHVVLYPGLLDPQMPNWLKHFVAYARGANNVTRLDDLNGN